MKKDGVIPKDTNLDEYKMRPIGQTINPPRTLFMKIIGWINMLVISAFLLSLPPIIGGIIGFFMDKVFEGVACGGLIVFVGFIGALIDRLTE